MVKMHKAVILPLFYNGVKLRPSQYGNHRYCKYVGTKWSKTVWT